MTSTSGRDDLSPFAAPWLDLTRLQNVSKPEVDPNGLTRAHVDRSEKRKPLSENALPTKGVHRREVSHSRTVSFDSRRLYHLVLYLQ